MRESGGEDTKHQMTSLSLEYVLFGNGRHAWFGHSYFITHFITETDVKFQSPGRFFAVTQLKALLSHVLMNYDVKLEIDGVRPPDRWLGITSRSPDPTGVVMFRKRSDSHDTT